jgi:exodeoxyribonuclease VII small subunit
MSKRQPKAESPAESTFEQLLERLEAAVGQLEEGELSLDESLKQYVEAVEIYRRCRRMLEEAQQRIEVLLEDASGERQAEPFDVEPDASASDE